MLPYKYMHLKSMQPHPMIVNSILELQHVPANCLSIHMVIIFKQMFNEYKNKLTMISNKLQEVSATRKQKINITVDSGVMRTSVGQDQMLRKYPHVYQSPTKHPETPNVPGPTRPDLDRNPSRVRIFSQIHSPVRVGGNIFGAVHGRVEFTFGSGSF